MPPPSRERPPALLAITVRRSLAAGRTYLVYAIVVSVLLSVGGALSGGQLTFPLILPVFGVAGSMGALLVFATDRLKGVLEALLAYGLSPRVLFANMLSANLVLVSIVDIVLSGATFAVSTAAGVRLSLAYWALLALYTVPMSYASAAFAATLGIYWSALTSPRQGVYGPVGLVPLVGVLPPLATLFVIESQASSGALTVVRFFLVAGLAVGGLTAAVLVLVGFSERLLQRERFLSPA